LYGTLPYYCLINYVYRNKEEEEEEEEEEITVNRRAKE
jgi:hypothetical protein